MQEISKLREQVKLLEKEYAALTELEEFIWLRFKVDYKELNKKPVINNFLKAVYNNLGKSPNGYRYDNLHEFFNWTTLFQYFDTAFNVSNI